MSKRRFLRVLNESEYNFNSVRTKKIREKFKKLKYKFSKPKIKEIGRKLFEIEKNENPSRLEKEDIEQYLTESEEDLFRVNKYYDYDDAEYRGIRDIGILFGDKVD